MVLDMVRTVTAATMTMIHQRDGLSQRGCSCWESIWLFSHLLFFAFYFISMPEMYDASMPCEPFGRPENVLIPKHASC